MATDFSSVVRTVVTMLVDRDYDGLEKSTNSMRLTAEEIAQAVQDYGATLVMPPPSVFNELDVVEVEKCNAENLVRATRLMGRR